MADHTSFKKDFKSFSRSQKVTLITLVVSLVLVGVAVPVILSSNMIFSVKLQRDYKVNELSDEDLLSPLSFSFINEDITREKRQSAADSVMPYFVYSVSESYRMRTKIEELYDVLTANGGKVDISAVSDEGLRSYLSLLSSLPSSTMKVASITRETVSHFISSGVFQDEDIQKMMKEGKSVLLVESSSDISYLFESREKRVEDAVTVSNLRSSVYQYLIQTHETLSFDEIQMVADLSQMVIRPNVSYDEVYTAAIVESVTNSVEPEVVKIEKGDYILRTDTLVTPEQLYILEVLKSMRVFNVSPWTIVPKIVMVAAFIFFWLRFQLDTITYSYRKAQYTTILLTMMILVITLGFFLSWSLITMGYNDIACVLPFFIVGMIATTINNSRTSGLAATLLLAGIYMIWPTSQLMSFFYLVATGSVINMAIKNNKGRFGTIVTSFKCAFFVSLVTVFFGILMENPWLSILLKAGAAAGNVIVTFIVYSILMPVLEHTFNIPTKQRLYELAYNDNAVLNQLAKVAQGTYNHVKNVSDLAYNGAVAIGANAELALVGARYHDIGKMVHPEYFVENQSERNAHDSISSQLSRSIIKSHVRLGTEKGKEIGLPQEILDIIGEHHGNDIIRYFYNEAVKNAGENSTVAKEDFMYDGNIPSTRESAIVMLADCVEAATRTIRKPNHQKYEKFISSIISDKIAHGQLDSSSLTMDDLKKLKEAFIQPLFGRDHHRISYDNDKD